MQDDEANAEPTLDAPKRSEPPGDQASTIATEPGSPPATDHEPAPATEAEADRVPETSAEADREPETSAEADREPTPTPPRWRRLVAPLGRGVAIAVVLLLGIAIGRLVPTETDTTDTAKAEPDEIWTCSMHPQIRMTQPGRCPSCGMKLVLADTLDDEDGSDHAAAPTVTLSARARALAQIRTEPVRRTEPRAELRLLGRVDYDETRLRMVTPWTKGRIDALEVRVTGERVRKGQVVAQLYSPEVYAAMRDLVVAAQQAERLSGSMHGASELAAATIRAARERLRLLGVTESQIRTIERKREAPRHVPIRSAFSGTVLLRNVEQGDYVEPSTALFHIADLSQVWVQIDAYESDLPHLAVGQTVLLDIDSLPGETFTGTVAFIDPVIDAKTRTARVRVEVDNEDRRIRPGMFAQATIEADIGDQASHLVIPATAPLYTGRRSIVYVAVPGTPGTYALREVRLGPRTGPVYPVLAGLAEGELVVSQGAFIVDADLQLDGGRSMMTHSDDLGPADAPSYPVTEPMAAELEPVMQAYLAAQRALADDALDDARAALEQLATVAKEVEMSGPRAAVEDWRAIASGLVGHGRHAAAATENGPLRTAFEHVSAQILEMLRAFGNPTEVSLRVISCPMAFDDRGAQWVQADGAIANPYYGAEMLTCGDPGAIVLPDERLATPRTATPPPAAAAMTGHQH